MTFSIRWALPTHFAEHEPLPRPNSLGASVKHLKRTRRQKAWSVLLWVHIHPTKET